MLLHAEVLFKNVDPKRLLKRGFSITRNKDGEIVKNVRQVGEREKIMIELSEGVIGAEVVK
jgi:exonuclease VII large subunit